MTSACCSLSDGLAGGTPSLDRAGIPAGLGATSPLFLLSSLTSAAEAVAAGAVQVGCCALNRSSQFGTVRSHLHVEAHATNRCYKDLTGR